jgi:hypothetical protein
MISGRKNMFATEEVGKQTIDLMFKRQPGSYNGVISTSVPEIQRTSCNNTFVFLKFMTFALSS